MEIPALQPATMGNILITPQIHAKLVLQFASFALIFQFVHLALHLTIFSKIHVFHLVLMATTSILLDVRHAFLLVPPVIAQLIAYLVRITTFCTMETVMLPVHPSLPFRIL